MIKVGIVSCVNIFTMHATSANHLPNSQSVGVCDVKKSELTEPQKNTKAYLPNLRRRKKELYFLPR